MSIVYLAFGCLTKCLYVSTDIIRESLILLRGGDFD